jgi:hypothetical protein
LGYFNHIKRGESEVHVKVSNDESNYGCIEFSDRQDVLLNGEML